MLNYLKFILFTFVFTNVYGTSDDEKIRILSEMNTKKAVVMLTQDEFENLVKPSPRNFAVIVLVTALDASRGCQVCVAVHQEYELLAKSWVYAENHSDKLFFVLIDVDYGNGIEVIRSLGLVRAPVILHFAANHTKKSFDTFEPKTRGYTLEIIAKWIEESTGISIKIEQPSEFNKYIVQLIAIFAILVVLVVIGVNNLFIIACNRMLWSFISIGFIMKFISGHVWNSIREPPFSRFNPKTGGKSYIARSTSYQFIAETYLVIFLYSLISLGFVCLNQASRFKILIMLIGILGVAFFFSALLFIFEAKNQGYPYGISNLITINFSI